MESCKDLVSVIVPIYNMEKYLDRCVQSILQQTYTNLEILLIDDGSTDQSLQLMKYYEEQDQRVHVFHKENGGVSSARNLGLEKMHGEYCTFIDPDDYVADVYVEWLYEAIKKTGSDLSIGGAISVQAKEFAAFPQHQQRPTVSKIDIKKYSLWGKGARQTCWGILYCEKIINGIKFDESLSIAEDTLFFMNMLSKCKMISIIDEPLYAYVQHDS